MKLQTSTDCFPIEFHDMQEQRRVLFGKDVIAGLAIDRSFYRAQVEHELRAKLLRLRQKGAGLLSDEKGLLRLMLDSVSTFLVLARHALLLSGVERGLEEARGVRKAARRSAWTRLHLRNCWTCASRSEGQRTGSRGAV